MLRSRIISLSFVILLGIGVTAAAPSPAEPQEKDAATQIQDEFEKQWQMVQTEAPLVAVAYLKAVNAAAAYARDPRCRVTVLPVDRCQQLFSLGLLAQYLPAECRCTKPQLEDCRRCDPRPEEFDIGCELERELCEGGNAGKLQLYQNCLDSGVSLQAP